MSKAERLSSAASLRFGRDLFHKLLLHCGRQRFDWLPRCFTCSFFRFLAGSFQPRVTMCVETTGKEEVTMPQNVFFCKDCSKEFARILHIVDLEKDSIICPHCGGKHVTQQIAAFSAVTSKKS